MYLQGWQILAGFRQSPNHQSQIDLVPKALGYSLHVHKQPLCLPFSYHPLIETNVMKWLNLAHQISKPSTLNIFIIQCSGLVEFKYLPPMLDTFLGFSSGCKVRYGGPSIFLFFIFCMDW